MSDRETNEADTESQESHQRLAQVRDLLFGETARGLDERVERLAQHLDETERKFDAAAAALTERLNALDKASVDRRTLADALRAFADSIEVQATPERSR